MELLESWSSESCFLQPCHWDQRDIITTKIMMQRLKHIWSSIKVCGGGQGLRCMVSPVWVARFFQQTINPNSNSLFNKSPKSQGTPPQVYAYATMFVVVQNYPPRWFSWIFSFVINRSKISLGTTDFQGIRIMEDTTKSAQICSVE
jgi:hypothetical protein